MILALLLVALILFIIASLPYPCPVNLIALGLAFFTLAYILAKGYL